MTDPDTVARVKYSNQRLEYVRAKHGILNWNPPFCSCKCRGWQRSSPADFGVVRQRDWLLDAFNEHLTEMRAERRIWLAAQKAERKKT